MSALTGGDYGVHRCADDVVDDGVHVDVVLQTRLQPFDGGVGNVSWDSDLQLDSTGGCGGVRDEKICQDEKPLPLQIDRVL